MKFTKFGIVGYGHFGKFMARSFARERGASVLVSDIDATRLPRRGRGTRAAELPEIARCDVVVVAVPFADLEEALKGLRDRLGDDTVVMDVVSTKSLATGLLRNVLGDHTNLLATHPLFGPPSMKRMRKGQHLVVTYTQGERAEGFRRFLEKRFGLEILEMSPEAHDRTMAYMQALPFFVARALVDLDILELEHRDVLSLPSFEKLATIAAIEQHHTDGMFETSQRSNPFAAGARRQFIEILEELNGEIDRGQFTLHPDVHADP
ncbi:MAG: prephenate dehydrogenase/arogenate dehydrogenase family protein, partial [Acidimicrobiia bacterium]